MSIQKNLRLHLVSSPKMRKKESSSKSKGKKKKSTSKPIRQYKYIVDRKTKQPHADITKKQLLKKMKKEIREQCGQDSKFIDIVCLKEYVLANAKVSPIFMDVLYMAEEVAHNVRPDKDVYKELKLDLATFMSHENSDMGMFDLEEEEHPVPGAYYYHDFINKSCPPWKQMRDIFYYEMAGRMTSRDMDDLSESIGKPPVMLCCNGILSVIDDAPGTPPLLECSAVGYKNYADAPNDTLHVFSLNVEKDDEEHHLLPIMALLSHHLVGKVAMLSMVLMDKNKQLSVRIWCNSPLTLSEYKLRMKALVGMRCKFTLLISEFKHEMIHRAECRNVVTKLEKEDFLIINLHASRRISEAEFVEWFR